MSLSDSKGDDKLEKIKREAAEDASSYYAQADKGEEHDLKSEYGKPLAPIDPEKEEFNLVRTLSYLAFGGAALALVFILFFINKKVDNVGKEVGDLAPFKKEIGDHIVKITGDLDKLKSRVEQHERTAMITELKRALLTIEGVSTDSTPEIKDKSAQVVAGIQSMLDELGAGTKVPTVPATVAPVMDAKPEGTTPAPAADAKPLEGATPGTGAPAPDVKPAEGATPATAPATDAKPGTPTTLIPATAPEAKTGATPPASAGAAKKKAASDDDDDDDD